MAEWKIITDINFLVKPGMVFRVGKKRFFRTILDDTKQTNIPENLRNQTEKQE